MDPVLVAYITMVLSGIAAIGGVLRVAQNERSYKLMRNLYKKRKKK